MGDRIVLVMTDGKTHVFRVDQLCHLTGEPESYSPPLVSHDRNLREIHSIRRNHWGPPVQRLGPRLDKRFLRCPPPRQVLLASSTCVTCRVPKFVRGKHGLECAPWGFQLGRETRNVHNIDPGKKHKSHYPQAEISAGLKGAVIHRLPKKFLSTDRKPP